MLGDSPAAGGRLRRIEVDDLRRVLTRPRVSRLANGMQVCVLENRRVPVVATTVIYRAGCRDEEPGAGGTAHFLEHMMFKGSVKYGAGEIDLMTRALGGSNNAFTSHDSTVYYFTFAADRWRSALDVEADRMAGLTLDPKEVDSERQVILEEISMYEGEPWDALDRQVSSTFFAPHAYGRPVLGTREELADIDAAVLRRFHQRFYRPENAVLVVAGDVEPEVEERVAEIFGGLGEEGPEGPGQRTAVASRSGLQSLQRFQQRRGEVARMLLELPAPQAGHPDSPPLLLLAAILATGRSSRLHRALVDEGQMCPWVATDVQESLDPGAIVFALEAIPGVEPQRVEAELLNQLDRLRREGPTAREVERAKRVITADWVFGHEKVFQQAFLAGSALALHDLEHPWRTFERLLAAEVDEVADVAARYLDYERDAVLGWSMPER